MKHVSIIVPAGQAVLSSVVGSFKLFNAANKYLIDSGQRNTNLFEIDMVGIGHETHLYNNLFTMRANKLIDEVPRTDLIIVTTINGDIPEELHRNRAFVDWMVNQRVMNNAEVASLCMGAFLLAETGLLDGRSCTTHWMGHDAFRAMYPQINLLPEKIITVEDGLYTSGGAYSFLNLLLHLVEKHAGREVALFCSKLFEIDFNRSNQNEFILFQGQKEHSDAAVRKAQEFIETHVADKINIGELSEQVAVSRRSFVRRFKKATGNTPIEYIQRVKIEAAKKQLESSPQNVSEVMYSIGYSDTKAFRNIFRKFTGLSPLEYRMKYNFEMAPI